MTTRPAIFPADALDAFAAAYPDGSTLMRHHLVGHPLLSRNAIGRLAQIMDPARVEYNLGNLPLGLRPEDTPHNGLSLADTIATIGENGSWAVLKNVETMPEYAALLDDALATLDPLVRPVTGAMLHREAFIFITSPGSITPFHMDPEHNILLQIEGDKTFVIFPAGDEALVPATKSESFHLGGHRNLEWDDGFESKATHALLHPGDAILVPVKAPHYVRNMNNVSVSLSITWRSNRSVAESELHAFNARLRARGWPLVPVGQEPERQAAARLGYRIARKLGV